MWKPTTKKRLHSSIGYLTPNKVYHKGVNNLDYKHESKDKKSVIKSSIKLKKWME